MNWDQWREWREAVDEELICEFGTDCGDLKVDVVVLLSLQNEPAYLAAAEIAQLHNLRPKGMY